MSVCLQLQFLLSAFSFISVVNFITFHRTSLRFFFFFLISPFIVPPVLLQTVSTLGSLLREMHPMILLLLCCITTDRGMAPHFYEVSRSHSTTHHSQLDSSEWVDQFVAETSTWQHTTITTDKHPCPPTCWGFLFTLKYPTASAGFEPANLGTKGQHVTSRPPKPLEFYEYGCVHSMMWSLKHFMSVSRGAGFPCTGIHQVRISDFISFVYM